MHLQWTVSRYCRPKRIGYATDDLCAFGRHRRRTYIFSSRDDRRRAKLDYRFTWLRDASYTLLSLVRAGYSDFVEHYTSWVYRTIQPYDIKILYPIEPDSRTNEEELKNLSGYRGSRPVRIGNEAADQLQLDVFGELFGAIYYVWQLGLFVPIENERKMREMLDWICDNWMTPENGIWEMRRTPQFCLRKSHAVVRS